jgi:hypothetical protein
MSAMTDDSHKGEVKTERKGPSFSKVLGVIAEHNRRHWGKRGGDYLPQDDKWLKDYTRAEMLIGVIGIVGFDKTKADGGIGFTEVDPERWVRILREIASESIMRDIKITARCGTMRDPEGGQPCCSWVAEWNETNEEK